MKKRITVPAKPLSQRAVKALEDATVNSTEVEERVIAGTIRSD